MKGGGERGLGRRLSQLPPFFWGGGLRKALKRGQNF